MTEDVRCPKCDGWHCWGCFTQFELDELNDEILENARISLVSTIVSKPYVVERGSKSIELKVPSYARYDFMGNKEAKKIMKRDAKLLEMEK